MKPLDKAVNCQRCNFGSSTIQDPFFDEKPPWWFMDTPWYIRAMGLKSRVSKALPPQGSGYQPKAFNGPVQDPPKEE